MLISNLKWQRLAIAIVVVIAIADLLPHPLLSPGGIVTALSKLDTILRPASEPPPTLNSSLEPM